MTSEMLRPRRLCFIIARALPHTVFSKVSFLDGTTDEGGSGRLTNPVRGDVLNLVVESQKKAIPQWQLVLQGSHPTGLLPYDVSEGGSDNTAGRQNTKWIGGFAVLELAGLRLENFLFGLNRFHPLGSSTGHIAPSRDTNITSEGEF